MDLKLSEYSLLRNKRHSISSFLHKDMAKILKLLLNFLKNSRIVRSYDPDHDPIDLVNLMLIFYPTYNLDR